MIRLALPVHPAEGFAIDLICPVVICDACGGVIDAQRPGNLLWSPDDDRAQFHAHKGSCDRRIDPHSTLYSRELDQWVDQLRANYRKPMIGSRITLQHSGDRVTVTKLVTERADALANDRDGVRYAATIAHALAIRDQVAR